MEKYAVSCPHCDARVSVKRGVPCCPHHGEILDTEGVEPTGDECRKADATPPRDDP